ncbi:hypothetical protein F4776DRAFT_669930 [Hypoxylon sp. NC0597]|nr:hypothetical protein F4776DRAFT_669930 [Hypoxylon sp. NC0597]
MAQMSNPDNPPTRPGLGRTTIGVEFEFLAAVQPSVEATGDPHPLDDRWQARNLGDLEPDDERFRVTVRNAIIDTLRANGIVAVKSEERDIGLIPTSEFDWSDSLEDSDQEQDIETATNRQVLDWHGVWVFSPALTSNANIESAARHLLESFEEFHTNNGLDIHRTSMALVRKLANEDVRRFVQEAEYEERVRVADLFYRRAEELIKREKMAHRAREAAEIDPLSVPLLGASLKYRAWACTIDVSVGSNDVLVAHYDIPDGSVPDLANLPPGDLGPARLYDWFPGELRTPILDYNHPQTYPSIQRACASLRNVYRIHKPMSVLGTGLHVHFGQEGGWTLLHLKKFASIWILFEESFERLHRRDRSNDNFFATPLRTKSAIARAFLPYPIFVERLSDLRKRNPQMAEYYRQRMDEHIPTLSQDLFPQNIKDVIREIWIYDSITKLCEGLGGDGYGSVKFRCAGQYLSSPIDSFHTQTLEVRLMQGTMDADHIWRWITICYQLLIYARDTDPEQFYNGILAMLTSAQTPSQVLGIPQEIMNWFAARLDGQGQYFVYPDNDRVNWANPFMSRGHGETHS